MDLQLTGKRAIVTGGSKGIGLAIAKALIAEGAAVAIAARDVTALQAAAASIGAIAIEVDTADEESVERMVATAVERLGGVDILVNSAAEAATPGSTGFMDQSDEEFRRQFEVKVLGYVRCARAVAPHLIEQGWGRIVNVSGLAARQTGSTIGSIRNIAVAAMTKNIADEIGHLGVNVTAVHPGLTRTERTAGMTAALAVDWGVGVAEVEHRLAAKVSIGRIVSAEEVASVVAFLASPLSVAINGDSIPVGGGALGSIHY
ncbi:MAG: short-chain dehydrogenase [Microbacteriaceae bacterium]|nr:short-chain dehydrogenase [Microbacteriaceae bacterium]